MKADLSRMSISTPQALYEAFKLAEAVLLGVANQPRVEGTDAEDVLQDHMATLDNDRMEVVREIRRRRRPYDDNAVTA